MPKPERRAAYAAAGNGKGPPIVAVQLPVGAGEIRRIQLREVFVDGRDVALGRIRRRRGWQSARRGEQLARPKKPAPG